MPAEIPMQQTPFAIQKNDGRSRVSTLENVRNFYLEVQSESAESPLSLLTTPGLRLFAEIPDVGGILGMHVARDILYVVTSRALYRVQENSYAKVADHTVYDRVSMADNGEIMMYVDGYTAYAYTFETQAFEVVDIEPCNTVIYQDGYFLCNVKKTNKFIVSNLDSVEFDPLQFASAEGDPDYTLALLSDHREVWIFGERTTEVWYNSGAEVPFDPIQGAFVEKGIASSHAVTKANNTVYWLGHDKIVYAAAGYQPQRVSNFSIEEKLEFADLRDSFMTTYTEEGHIFIWLTVPDLRVTYVYDVSNGLWHERTNLTEGRHLANNMADWRGRTVVGDFRNGKIYTFDLDYAFDNDELIERKITLPPRFFQGNRARDAVFELKAQNFGNTLVQQPVVTGVWTADSTCVTADSETATADGSASSSELCCKPLPNATDNPMVGLRYTDNHGNTYSNWTYKPMAEKGNQFLRWRWFKLGSYFERSYELRMVAPISGVWIGAYIG